MAFGVEAAALLGGADNGLNFDLIEQSAMFDSASTSYLTLAAQAGAGTNTKFAGSAWVRRGLLGLQQYIVADDNGPFDYIRFNTDDTISLVVNAQVATSTAKFRDPSGYYHVCWIWCAASGDDVRKVWVNGELVVDTDGGSTSSTSRIFQSSYGHHVGRGGASSPFDGYLADVVIMDDASAV